ncbi:MAG: site-specific integrase [Clostridia bacterium]|nr:site-specific integrase [Clostridia bacterium]
MAKRQRFHIDLPEGDLWFTGNTVSEAFLNGFERYQRITQMPAEPSIPPSPPFREVFEQYQSIFWKKLRASTRTNYQHQANKRILPAFGHISIAEITVADIQLCNRMEAEGLKRSTIDMVKKIMNPVMEYTLELGMISKNPFHAKKLLSVGGQKETSHKPISPEDMQIIRKALPDLPEQERLLLALLSYTGERSGEVCGFQWEDIDYANRQLKIQRGVSWVTRNQPTVGPPKTENSLRSIPLTKTFLEALQPDGQSGFILQKPDGSPLSYTMFSKLLKRTLKRIGFEEGKYTAHDFRATCATEWMEAGVPLKTISAMLGHRDTRTTERYYARLRPEVAYEGVAAQIDAHLQKKHLEIDTVPA